MHGGEREDEDGFVCSETVPEWVPETVSTTADPDGLSAVQDAMAAAITTVATNQPVRFNLFRNLNITVL